MQACTLYMMFLFVVLSLTFAQSNLVLQTDTVHDRRARAVDKDRVSMDQPVMVAQAPAKAGACINPKTGQPDQLVQCVVAPCLSSYVGSSGQRNGGCP